MRAKLVFVCLALIAIAMISFQPTEAGKKKEIKKLLKLALLKIPKKKILIPLPLPIPIPIPVVEKRQKIYVKEKLPYPVKVYKKDYEDHGHGYGKDYPSHGGGGY